MLALNRNTAGNIDNTAEHIRQSIDDIVLTPIGSRVIRRSYGSLLPDLIDQPLNSKNILRLYAATAAAIMYWEPRLNLTSISFVQTNNSYSIEITGAINEVITPITINLARR